MSTVRYLEMQNEQSHEQSRFSRSTPVRQVTDARYAFEFDGQIAAKCTLGSNVIGCDAGPMQLIL